MSTKTFYNGEAPFTLHILGQKGKKAVASVFLRADTLRDAALRFIDDVRGKGVDDMIAGMSVTGKFARPSSDPSNDVRFQSHNGHSWDKPVEKAGWFDALEAHPLSKSNRMAAKAV